ncbi:hypothetical protein PSYJA_46456, partial [Pseudomonas syringae pv. japonica str. M301072]
KLIDIGVNLTNASFASQRQAGSACTCITTK